VGFSGAKDVGLSVGDKEFRGLQGSGFRLLGWGLRVRGLGLRVQEGSGFRVQRLWFFPGAWAGEGPASLCRALFRGWGLGFGF